MKRLPTALLFALLSTATSLHAINIPPTATEYGYVDSDGGPPPGGGIDSLARRPVYDWVNLVNVGAVVIESGDNVSSLTPRGQGGIGATVSLGHPFPMFGVYHETLTPTSNGFLSNARSEDGADNTPDCPFPPKPLGWTGGARIAPFHCDLELGSGKVRYRYFEKSPHPFRKCGVSVFSWDGVTIKANGLELSFQALLFDTGDILFQYVSPWGGNDIGSPYSIGVHDADARESIAYQCSKTGVPDDILNGFAVRIEPYEIFVSDPAELAQAVVDIPQGGKIRFNSFQNSDMSVLGGPVIINKSLALDGGRGLTTRTSGPPRLSGGDSQGLFRIRSGARVLINECELIEGAAAADGGAILNDGGKLKLSCVSFRDNRAGGRGGAVASLGASAELVMGFCNVMLNESGSDGGAVYAEGGAVLHSTTLFANHAGAPGASARGGGLFLSGAQATLTNTTLSNNSADEGGSACYLDGGDATMGHCTVYENAANGEPYAIYSVGGQLSIDHSIVAGNPGNFKGIGGGATTSGGNNIEDRSDFGFGGPTDLSNTDPDLTPIGLHGGTVLTHLPRAASPAIDGGAPTSLARISTVDARGFPRAVDSDANGSVRRDVGAVEAGERLLVNITSGSIENNLPAGQISLMNAIRDAPDGAHIVFDASLSGAEIDLLSLDQTYAPPTIRQFDIEQSFLFFDGSLAVQPVQLNQFSTGGGFQVNIYLMFAREGMVSIDSINLAGRGQLPMLNLSNSSSPDFELVTELLIAEACELEQLTTGLAWLRDLNVGAGVGGTITVDDTPLGPTTNSELRLAMPDLLQMKGIRSTSLSLSNSTHSNNQRVRLRGGEFAGSDDAGIETGLHTFREIVIEDVVSRDHAGRGLSITGSFVTIDRCSILNNQGGGLSLGASGARIRHCTISGNVLTMPTDQSHGINGNANNPPPAGGDPKYQAGGAAVEFNSSGSLDSPLSFEFCTIYNNTYHSHRQLDDCLGHDDPDVDGVCNHSTSPDRGTGGILFDFSSQATIRNCIIARNRVTYRFFADSADDPTTRPYIDNLGFVSPLVPYDPNHDPDESLNVRSLSGNLLDTYELDLYGITAGSDLQGTDPHLGPLFDHGGSPPCHMPLAISPAIDKALGLPGDHVLDVRGRDRTTDGDANGKIFADIGAVEADRPLVVTTAVDQDNGPSGGTSLREAVADANEYGRIIFDPSLSGDTIELGAAATGQASAIDIETSVTIDATSVPEGMTVDAGHKSRCLNLFPDQSVAIHAVSFVNGKASGEPGGGIANAADLLLTRSLVAGNTTDDRGGAIYHGPGTLQLHNVTITENFAATGSAVANFQLASGEMELRHCTIANNIAGNGPGVQIDDPNTEVSFASTIVAGNFNNGGGVVKNVNGSASFTSLGFNLLDVGGIGPSSHIFDILDTQPILAGNPSDEGGFCQVLVLKPDSPAIDAGWYPYGHPNIASNRDSRGALRQLGNFGRRLDIGAYETYSLDRDGDKLPDAWEQEQALDPDDPSDALVDGDCDGEDHLTEFLNGNDPWEFYGRLCDHRPEPVWNFGPGGSNVTFDFPSLTPPTQPSLRLGVQIEISEDLKTWRPFRDATPSGLGIPAGLETIALSTPRPSNPRIFYRGRYVIDLSGTDLNGVDLSGVDFSRLDLSGTDFGGADLSDADLSETFLDDVIFDDTKLEGVLLQGVVGLELPAFPGAATDDIAVALPPFRPIFTDADFSNPNLGDEEPGPSHNSVGIMFTPGMTTAEANAFLNRFDAKLIGAIPGEAPGDPAIFCVRTTTDNHTDLAPLLQQMRDTPSVIAAARELLAETDATPLPTGAPTAWKSWLPSQLSSGNWGMKYIRAPQLWNFNEAIFKRLNLGEAERFTGVGVVDSALTRLHPEFAALPLNVIGTRQAGIPDPTPRSIRHGTHVVGTIAAPHRNGGVDGVTPFASVTFNGSRNATSHDRMETFGSLGAMINDLADSNSNIRVINMSMGYSCGQRLISKNPNVYEVDPALRSDIMAWGNMVHTIWTHGSRPIVVTTAGNSSSVAQFNNPFTYAALVLGTPCIFVVENMQSDFALSDTSCSGGNISAPGTEILSSAVTVPGKASGLYQHLSGTSMAAPHVTGTIAYLYSLQPGLSKSQIETLLENNRNTRGTGNGLDAWAAAMDIDRVFGGDDSLRMMVDIDDGSADGNLRLNYSVDTAADEADDDPTLPLVTINESEDIDGDGGLGDGEVNMRDYRRARDWALIAAYGGPTDTLDGPTDSVKHDANRNGIVEEGPESYYPRNDFNGDGQGTGSDDIAHVPGIINGQASDLLVLQQLFLDPLYEADDLNDFGWNTADLHIALFWFSDWNDSNGGEADITSVTVRVASTDEASTFDMVFAIPIPDTADPDAVDVVLSIPSNLEYEVEVCGSTLDDNTYGETLEFTAGLPGTDHYFSPRAFLKQEAN